MPPHQCLMLQGRLFMTQMSHLLQPIQLDTSILSATFFLSQTRSLLPVSSFSSHVQPSPPSQTSSLRPLADYFGLWSSKRHETSPVQPFTFKLSPKAYWWWSTQQLKPERLCLVSPASEGPMWRASASDPSSNTSSSSTPPPNPDKDACPRDMLEKARITLEACLPHFFRGYFLLTHHHPSAYHPKVVMEYSFHNRPRRTQGVFGVMTNLILIKFYFQATSLWCKLTLTSVYINEAESSVELGVRVNRVRGNYRYPKSLMKSTLNDMETELMKAARWDDYRVIVRITKSGHIKYIRITQLPPAIGSRPEDEGETWLDTLWNRWKGRIPAPVQ